MRRAWLILGLVLMATGAVCQMPDFRDYKQPPFLRGPGDPLLDRLSRMPAEERRHLLESLSPERRKRLEARLKDYMRWSPEERNRMQDRFQAFRSLPPERQEAMRQAFRKFNDLPEERRFAVERMVQHLRWLPPEERRERMSSEEFRTRFSPAEQQVIEDLMKGFPPIPPRPDEFGPRLKKR